MWRFVLMLLICLSLTAYEVEAGTHILGGTAAKPGQFPYLASLQRYNQISNLRPVCGASIISPRLLITAAHCLRYADGPPPTDVGPEELAALVGTVNPKKGRGVIYLIERWVIHEKFNYITLWHDLGLLKTKSRIQFSELVQPIKLLTREIPAGAKLKVAGWGATATISILNNNPIIDREGSDNALYLSTKNLNIKICAKKFKNQTVKVSASTHLCSNDERGTGACVGDSGGPLVHSGHLAGIVQFSYDEKVSETESQSCGLGPEVYTKVSVHINWINKHKKLLMKSNNRKKTIKPIN